MTTMERLRVVHEMTVELWRTYRHAYETMADTDEWWDTTITTMSTLTNKYNQLDRIPVDMASAYLEDLEAQCKKARTA